MKTISTKEGYTRDKLTNGIRLSHPNMANTGHTDRMRVSFC